MTAACYIVNTPDTGKWGYVFNESQVVVFIDCTHKSGRGRPWYQERGVY